MTKANDSILVTPGSGATVATHLADAKEYQVVMVAHASGHIKGTMPSWYIWSTYDAGAQNEILIDLFNATGSGVVLKVRKLFIQHNMAAIVGIGHTFNVDKTSAVGTGGTSLTPRPVDSANTALPAQVTARHAATGGATLAHTLFSAAVDPEETRPGAAIMGMINWLPEGDDIQDLTLRENEGMRVQQITSSTVGVWGCLLLITVE